MLTTSNSEIGKQKTRSGRIVSDYKELEDESSGHDTVSK